MVRGIVQFCRVSCVLFVTNFLVSESAYGMSCASSMAHLRQVSAFQEPMELDIRPHLSRPEKDDLRLAFRDRVDGVRSDFEKLLELNQLVISRYNEEGVPVLTSLAYPDIPASQGVLATLVVNRINFTPKSLDPFMAFDELGKAFSEPNGFENMRFKDLGNGFSLFVELTSYGLVIGMRRDADGQVLVAGVPEGGETYSPQVLHHIFSDLLHIAS